MPELHDLCRHVGPGQATARFSHRAGFGDQATRLEIALEVTLRLACAGCDKASDPYVTVSPAALMARAQAEGWRPLDGKMLCDDCYTERAVAMLSAEAQSRVVKPTDLAYHRGKAGGGRGGVLVTGRVVGRTPQGEEMLEEFVSVDGVLRTETIARSNLERVTTPISAEEARRENPHLFTVVKEWVRKQIYHEVDFQACAARLKDYTFYQHRSQPEHVRATGVFIRYPDGSGVAEIFYLEHRKLRRHCVGQTFVEDHFAPIPFDEALRLDKQLIARLDQWVRRQAA
jgi:hypothetical protein